MSIHWKFYSPFVLAKKQGACARPEHLRLGEWSGLCRVSVHFGKFKKVVKQSINDSENHRGVILCREDKF